MTLSSNPFTYLIGWSSHRAFYYGVRYGKDVSPKDLWTTYFTSSAAVANFRNTHGEPDITKIFANAEDARRWETKVLKRMKVVNRNDFLNLSDKPAPPSRLGTKHTNESKAKMKGPFTKERRVNISKTIQSMKYKFQKRWLITTPDTQFCALSLDILAENGWQSLYCSFRTGKPMSRGKLKGWQLTQIT